MASKLIKTRDGILVEVVVPEGEAEQIAGGFAKKVDTSIDALQAVITRLCEPVLNTWENLRGKVPLKELEVEFGLSFEGEGNLFLTKSKASANITVKAVIAPREK